MIYLVNIAFFVLSIFFFAWLALRDRSPIFLFRSIGLASSTIIVFAYNLNWIFQWPMSLFGISLLFIFVSLLIIYARHGKEKIFSRPKSFDIWWIIVVCSLAATFLIGYIYFQKELDVPRYSTPDSGTHYLYMSQAARTGLIPLFSPSEIYPASGHLKVFEHHHESYFPGAAAIAFVINKFFVLEERPILLQAFNILCYMMLTSYFLMIFKSKGYFKSSFFAGVAFAFLALGTFFDFVATSYSTQLLGLFILVFFLDVFYAFLEKRESFWMTAVGLAALVMTYVYWLPIAVMFIIIASLGLIQKIIFSSGVAIEKHKKMLVEIFFISVSAIILSVGYLSVLLKLNMVGHAADDGGFSFQGQMLSDALLVAPFAVVFLISRMIN